MLSQWFSNLNGPAELFKTYIADLVGPGWGPIICISNRFQVLLMLHFDSADLSHYQLLTPTNGLAYQTIETRSFLPQGDLDRVRLVEGPGSQRGWRVREGRHAKRQTEAHKAGWGH